MVKEVVTFTNLYYYSARLQTYNNFQKIRVD